MKSNTINVNKNILLALIDWSINKSDYEQISQELKNYEMIETEQIDTGRWESTNSLIFKYNNKYYEAPSYRLGLTENQESEPYEWDPDFLECEEVEKCEVISYEYRPIKQIN